MRRKTRNTAVRTTPGPLLPHKSGAQENIEPFDVHAYDDRRGLGTTGGWGQEWLRHLPKHGCAVWISIS